MQSSRYACYRRIVSLPERLESMTYFVQHFCCYYAVPIHLTTSCIDSTISRHGMSGNPPRNTMLYASMCNLHLWMMHIRAKRKISTRAAIISLCLAAAASGKRVSASENFVCSCMSMSRISRDLPISLLGHGGTYSALIIEPRILSL